MIKITVDSDDYEYGNKLFEILEKEGFLCYQNEIKEFNNVKVKPEITRYYTKVVRYDSN